MAPRDRNKTPPIRPRAGKAASAADDPCQSGRCQAGSHAQRTVVNVSKGTPAVDVAPPGHGAHPM
eukprot:1257377-Pleurochrysis_carterae.AAC.1